jgi:hypothetical protein
MPMLKRIFIKRERSSLKAGNWGRMKKEISKVTNGGKREEREGSNVRKEEETQVGRR